MSDEQEYNDYQAYQQYTAQAKAPAPVEPDISAFNDYVKKNLSDAKAKEQEKGDAMGPADPVPDGPQPHPAQGLVDALKAGWQTSVTGRITRSELPDTVLPEHAGMAMRMAQGIGQFSGDIPAMIAGFAGGAAAGSEIPVIGTAAGAAFGAWAAPAALRRAYVDSLQKGGVKDFGDFFERAGSALWEGAKAGTVGIATEGMGEVAKTFVGGAAPVATQVLSKFAAQLGTMTTLGSAMSNQMPKASDFMDGALMLAGLHGLTAGASPLPDYARDIHGKLQEIYAQTGLPPSEVALQAQADPVLKQELLAQGTNVPKSLESHVEKPQPNQELLSPSQLDMVKADVPKELSGTHPTLNDEFSSPTDEHEIQKPAEEEAPAATPPPENGGDGGNEPPSARDKILSSIGQEGDGKGTVDRFNSWYAKVVDKLNPVAKLVKALVGDESLPKKEDPYALLSTAKSRAFAQADQAVQQFKQILAPFGDDPNGFKAYGMAKRALELGDRGVGVGIDLDASKEYVEANKEKYQEAFQKVQDLQNAGLKKLLDSGVISQETHDSIRSENQSYFPMNVVQEEGSGGGKSSSNPIKKIFGSSAKKVDPFEQIVKNQFAYYRIAEENAGKAQLVKLAEDSPVGEQYVKSVPPTMRPVEISPQELNSYLTKYGVHEGDPAAMTVFRPLSSPLEENQIAVMQDGKSQVFEVDPSIAKAMSATAYEAPNMIQKVANAFATIQRIAITENPFFLAKHAFRDNEMATVQSQNGYRWGYDWLRGLGHFFTDSADFHDFLNNGGGQSTVVDFDQKYMKDDIWGLSKKTGLLDKALNVIKTPLDLMRSLAQGVFTAPKMGEFLRAREAGKDSFTAAYEGRNVTPDVQKQGSEQFIRAWSAATPFFTMRIKGLDNMVDAFRRDPVGTSSRMALAITLPSIATWWAFKDDDRYKNAANWEKDMYWLIPTGGPDGPTMKVPKPFEPGLMFGSLVERTLDEFYRKKPEAFKGFGSAIFDDTLPNVIPPVISPVLEQFANRSRLTGGNIVPHSLEGVAPAYQYNSYTSETAKKLGQIMSYIPGVKELGHDNITPASPMVIQNYVRAWGGDIGMFALQVADKGLEAAGLSSPPPIKPASTLSDIPFVKSFFARYPSSGAQPIQDFFDNFAKSQTTHQTVTHLAKSGDVRAANAYLASPEAQENMVNLVGMEKALSTQNALIQKVNADPSMSANDKRQQIDTLYYQMIQIAGQGNELMDVMRKKGAQ